MVKVAMIEATGVKADKDSIFDVIGLPDTYLEVHEDFINITQQTITLTIDKYRLFEELKRILQEEGDNGRIQTS